MTETKNTNTYTELEIARALTHMTDTKKDLLCSTLKIVELKELASNNAYSAKSAHPFQRNGALFRLKLSGAQLID